jgi:hypothetical protein
MVGERLADELALLEAMYPGQVRWESRGREVTFVGAEHGDGSRSRLVLRVPEKYPDEGQPEVLEAQGGRRRDEREWVRELLCREAGSEGLGREVLDVVIGEWVEMVGTGGDEVGGRENEGGAEDEEQEETGSDVKTTVIWLHHLLATSKRKLAIKPTTLQDKVTGITKPGYPGVMVFSGQKKAVENHVAELKGLNWQAFAIRYEADELWKFEKGIKEVETMAEVVQSIEEGRREGFLKAVGVK